MNLDLSSTPVILFLVLSFVSSVLLGVALGIITKSFDNQPRPRSTEATAEANNPTMVHQIADLPDQILDRTIERISKTPNRITRLNHCLTALLKEKERRNKTPS